MKFPKPHTTDSSASEGRTWLGSPWFLALILILVTALLYSNALYGGFQYDDQSDILGNSSIRKLWPIKGVFVVTKLGHTYLLNRPIVNLTFAINYFTGGLNPLHFHITNVVIHILGGLLFSSAIRRTLSIPTLQNIFGSSIPLLSLLIATFWLIHPIQTESVAYITQRYESLMGLFSIGSFYCLIRSRQSKYTLFWSLMTAFSCLLALGSKEVAVSIPILILLFDRAFMAGTFKGAWRQRRPMYLALLLAWALFGLLQTKTGGREWAGFELGTPWWKYALSQPGVIMHYLKLAIWPHPLCFDYTWPVAESWREIIPGFIVIGFVFILTIVALIRRPGLGFLGASFFLILAPTSSVMPILDLAIEHRMYLPLAPVSIAIILGGYWIWMEILVRMPILNSIHRVIALITIIVVSSSFGILTYLRNEDYKTALELWEDSVRKVPNNPRANLNYAHALQSANRIDEAIFRYKKCIELAPNSPMGYNGLGVIYGLQEKYSESLFFIKKAISLAPNDANYYNNLGNTLFRKNSFDNAAICFQKALELNPYNENALYNSGQVHFKKRQFKDAAACYRRAIELNPSQTVYRARLGIALMEQHLKTDALMEMNIMIKYSPNPAEVKSLIGLTLFSFKWDRESIPYFQEALRIKPDHITTLVRLGWVLATSPDSSVRNGYEAIKLAEKAISLSKEKTPEHLALLAASQAEINNFKEAQATMQTALDLSKEKSQVLRDQLQKHLSLYQSNHAFRDDDHTMSIEGTLIRN